MLYLVINHKGYYLGTSEKSTENRGKSLGKYPKRISCYNVSDAENCIKTFLADSMLRVHEPEIVIGKLILFQPVITVTRIDLLHNRSLRADDTGNVEIRLNDTNERYSYRVSMDSHEPDARGRRFMKKHGRLYYFDFDEGKIITVLNNKATT